MNLLLFLFLGLSSALETVVVDVDDGDDVSVPQDETFVENEKIRINPVTGKRMYSGYQLLRAEPETQEHLDILRFLSKGEWTRKNNFMNRKNNFFKYEK